MAVIKTIKVHLLALVVIAIFICLVVFGKALVRKLDVELFHEKVLDVYGGMIVKQDWEEAHPLNRPMDYGWLTLDEGLPFIRVGHALGYEPAPNSEKSLLNSIKVGLKVVEVDLWLDSDGYLRCHHGPDLPLPYKDGDCTFTSLIDYIQRSNVWVILDIKSDFYVTGNHVLEILHKKDVARHVIFQLYLPEHLAYFNTWANLEPLPGPIVTAYVSYRSLDHILSNLSRLGVQAFTFPLDRYDALSISRPDNVSLFTHPVHDCDSFRRAKLARVRGIYTTSGLLCP